MLQPATRADDLLLTDALWLVRDGDVVQIDPSHLERAVSVVQVEGLGVGADDLRRRLWVSGPDALRRYSFDGELTGLAADIGRADRVAINDADGALWVAVGHTLHSLDAGGRVLSRLALGHPVEGLLADSHAGLLWVVAGSTVVARDLVQGVPLQALERPRDAPIQSAVLDPVRREVWITTPLAVERYAYEGLHLETYPIPGLSKLRHDGRDAFWALSRSGLVHLNRDGEASVLGNPLASELPLLDLAVKGDRLWLTDGNQVARLGGEGQVLETTTTWAGIRELLFSPADNVAPTVNISSPRPGERMGPTDLRAVVEVADFGVGVDWQSLAVSVEGLTARPASASRLDCELGDASVVCRQTSRLASGEWVLVASVADRAGNRSIPVRVAFSVGEGSPGSSSGGLARSAPYPAQTTLTAAADTYIDWLDKNTNFGAAGILNVQLTSRGLALFDVASVIPSIVTLNSATLRVFIAVNANNWGDGGLVGAHRVQTAWTEAGATWQCPDDSNLANQEPDCPLLWEGGDFVSAPTDSVFHSNGLSGWIEFDLTADVAAMIAGTANHGWLLRRAGDSPGHVDYASRESATGNAPELVLDYVADDSDPPTLSIVSPSEGESVGEARPQIDLTYADTGSGIEESSLDVRVNGATGQVSCSTTPATATCQPIADLAEGSNTVTATIADVAGNTSTQASVTFTVDTIAPVITVTFPPDGTITNQPQLTTTGSLSESASLTLNGQAVTVNPDLTFGHQINLGEGANTLTYVAVDPAGNQASVVVTVTLDTVAPAPVDRDLVTLGQVTGGNSTVQGAAGAAEAGSTLTATNFRTGEAYTTQVAPGGSFTAVVPAQAEDVVSLVLTDAAGNTSSPTNVVVPHDPLPPPPPDPESVATPIDPTVPSDIARDTTFLYTGSSPIQTGVPPGTMDGRHVAVLKGRVLDRLGAPLPSVTVSILDHPHFGQTLTRTDGEYDLAVNGGDQLTLQFERPDLLTAHRNVDVEWRDYMVVEDVVLIPDDEEVTTILLGASDYQVIRGSVQTDADGSRQTTIIVPAGTQATMTLPGGSTQPLTMMTMRASEYTVGPSGPDAMPASLPPISGYTYAADLWADEAEAVGALSIEFSQPVIHYVENLVDFDAGTTVPVGFYDRVLGTWLGSDDGLVVDVLSINQGLTELDVDGSGMPASAATLAALGITDEERTELANLYVAGQSLWRAPMPHFSIPDFNWPFAPANSEAPPETEDRPLAPKPRYVCRSIIECEKQVLHERVAVVGSPLTLHYSSERVPGRVVKRSLRITLTEDEPPEDLAAVHLEVRVAGTLFKASFPSDPGQEYTYTWDGLDSYGRKVYGSVPADIRVGYSYPIVYYETVSGLSQAWAAARGEATNTFRIGNPDITIWTEYRRRVTANDPVTEALGGWSLTAQHFYDRDGQVLHLGTGARRGTGATTDVLERLAGIRGQSGFSGDGGLAIEAELEGVESLAVAADGGFCIGASSRVRCVDKDGIIQTVAGTGVYGYSGNGGPATAAQMRSPSALVLDVDGTLYIADTAPTSPDYIRIVDPVTGIIDTLVTVSGTNQRIFALEIGPDGNLYYADSPAGKVHRLLPNGSIEHVAGDGAPTGPTGDGGPAIQATVPNPRGLAFGADGSLYIFSYPSQIRRVGTDGFISRAAGHSNWYCTGPYIDVGPALGDCWSGARGYVDHMDVAEDGTTFIMHGSGVRDIREGVIMPGAGWKAYRTSGPQASEGAPADDARLFTRPISVFPNSDLLVGEGSKSVVWRVRNSMRGAEAGPIQIASEDGSMLYQFDLEGRHLRTVDTLTGVTLFEFQYDAAGLLTGVTDRDGNVTTVERDGSGAPTAVVSPFGQRTELGTDANGYLDSITNPNGEEQQFTYGPEGLMATMTDARQAQASFLYDSMGLLESDQDRAGGTLQLGRIEAGDLTQVSLTSPLSRTTLYEVEELDGDETERRVTNPAGNLTTTVWHTNGGRTRTGPDGTVVVYDPDGDPRFGMQSPVAEKVTVATPGGLLRTATSSRDVTLSDPFDPLSLTALTETTTVDGRTFTRSYDAGLDQLTLTSAEGRTSVFDLDVLGRVVSTTVGTLDPVSATYDGFGRLATLTQGTGAEERIVTFNYDASSRLSSIVDPLSQTTSFSYDAANRVTQHTLPGTEQIDFSYDPNGNLGSLTPPSQPAHGFAYTPLDFESTYTPPAVGQGPPETTTAYDLDRNVTSVTRPGGEVVSFGYDAGGRVDSVTAAIGTTTLGYDSAGRLSTVTAPGSETLTYSYDGPLPTGTTWSGTVAGSVTHGYDDSFRLTSESVNGAHTAAFGYDDDSLLTQAGSLAISRDAANGFVTGTTQGVVTTSRTHSGFGEMSSQVASVSGNEVYRADYVRDKLGRIVQKTETIQGGTAVWDYTYGPSGRLIQVDKDSVSFATYTYDANGNRLTYSGTFGSFSGTYDAQDRLLSYGGLTYTYTPAGELATKSDGVDTVSYTYDAFGALRTVALPTGITIDYVIDGQGRRVGKKVNGVLSQGFLYGDQLNPVAELDGAGAVVSRFVYGARANLPAYVETGGSTYRIVADHLGSVRLVVDTATGAVVQRIDYDEFGRVTLDTNPGFQPFGFAGGLYENQTGLVRFGARDYDPEVGRWTAKDPIGFRGGTSDLYVYVSNDPVNWIDPNGRTQRDIDLAIELVRETQPDLRMPRKFLPIIPKQEWPRRGLWNPLRPGRALLSEYYLEELTDCEALDLLDTVIHESLHKTTWPFKRHEWIYAEAARRTKQIQLEYLRRRKGVDG